MTNSKTEVKIKVKLVCKLQFYMINNLLLISAEQASGFYADHVLRMSQPFRCIFWSSWNHVFAVADVVRRCCLWLICADRSKTSQGSNRAWRISTPIRQKTVTSKSLSNGQLVFQNWLCNFVCSVHFCCEIYASINHLKPQNTFFKLQNWQTNFFTKFNIVKY